MLARSAFVAMAFLGHACTSGQSPRVAEEFRLCADHPDYKSVISIDYADLRGFSDDYSEPIRRCGEPKNACIDFPFLLSAPPRLPSSVTEVVRWSVGNDHFSIRQLPAAEGAYFIEAVDFGPGPDGRARQYGRGFYTYSGDVGVMTLRVEGDMPHGMVRCGGRLTFEDLRKLADRLPHNPDRAPQ